MPLTPLAAAAELVTFPGAYSNSDPGRKPRPAPLRTGADPSSLHQRVHERGADDDELPDPRPAALRRGPERQPWPDARFVAELHLQFDDHLQLDDHFEVNDNHYIHDYDQVLLDHDDKYVWSHADSLWAVWRPRVDRPHGLRERIYLHCVQWYVAHSCVSFNSC